MLYEGASSTSGGSNNMWGELITGGLSLLGNIFTGNRQARSQEKAAKQQADIAREELQFSRESGLLGFEAGIAEQRRRQQEAAFRAGKLEDVASMFQGLQGPSGGYQSVTAQQVGPLAQVAEMEDIAREMRAQEGSLDLRRAAMRELDLGGDAMNAALAASGVRGSGFGASQVRGMTGDVLGGLAQQIQQARMQALSGAAGIMGQAGQMDLSRMTANQQAALNAAMSNQTAALSAEQAAANFAMQRAQGISQVYQDEAFGANAPLDLSREEELLAEYRRRWLGDGEGGGAPAASAAVVPGPSGGGQMFAGGTPGFYGGGANMNVAGPALPPEGFEAMARLGAGGMFGGVGGSLGDMLGAGRPGVSGYDRNRAVV